MIKKMLSAACVLALAGAAQAATSWNMSTEQPDGNFLTQNAREFAADVKRATNGELNINVQSNSVLLKRPEVKRGVQQGVIDAMLTSPATGVDSQAWDYVKYYYDAQVFIPQIVMVLPNAM